MVHPVWVFSNVQLKVKGKKKIYLIFCYYKKLVCDIFNNNNKKETNNHHISHELFSNRNVNKSSISSGLRMKFSIQNKSVVKVERNFIHLFIHLFIVMCIALRSSIWFG